jgi:dTDP-glucose 4,6-dehydratase
MGGAIGVHLYAHIMHNTDWEVIGTDSFRHKGEFDRITEMLSTHPGWKERTRILTHDLTAPISSRERQQIGQIEILINLASLSDVAESIENPTGFIRNNTELMLNILEYARVVEPDVFLHFSTDEVYGPAGRDQAHPEWSRILPSNAYAASKACQEAIAISYWRSYGVPLIITNTMNNFGEMQGPSKYPVKVQKALNDGESVQVHVASDGQVGTRYYLHSRNASDAVLFILNNTKPYLHQPGLVDVPDRYNIVGDAQLDNLELAQTIADLMGKKLVFELVNFHADQPGHDLHYGLDGSLLAGMGWEAPMAFEESLKATIEWQVDHPEWLD